MDDWGHTRPAHPHVTTGEPCHCPWGGDPGLRKQASKIDWLRERADKFSKTPEGQRALQNLQDVIGVHGDKLDPLSPWLYREIKKGRLTPELRYPEGEGGGPGPVGPATHDRNPPFAHWADWFHSKSPTRQGVDIMQKQIGHPQIDHPNDWRNNPQAIQHNINDWDEELKSKMDEELANQDRGDVMHELDDGWHIRRLHPHELGDEGDAMGHCVGGYSNNVRNGECGIFSLRDPQGQPHVTVEMRPGDHGGKTHDEITDGGGRPDYSLVRPEGSKVVQIQGKSDTEPIDEYRHRVTDWFDSLHPAASAATEQTTIPVPRDPDQLQDYYEPEADYYNDDPYTINDAQAEEYGLDPGYDDQFDYEGPPDWDSIVDSHFLQHENRENQNRPYGSNWDPKRTREIAQELGHTDELEGALQQNHYPGLEEEFYRDRYLPDLLMSPAEQWERWDKGYEANQLLGGRSALQRGPQEEPIVHPYGPIEVSPQQGAFPLWEPSRPQGETGRMVGPGTGYYGIGTPGAPFPYQETDYGTRRRPQWFDVVSNQSRTAEDLSVDDPRRWEDQANWTPGHEGKGFLLAPHPNFPELQGKPHIVWTWNTENMLPMHSDVAARTVQTTPQGMIPDRSSYFHITPDGGLWTFGSGREIGPESLRRIQEANPAHFLVDQTPIADADPFGHAKNILDTLPMEHRPAWRQGGMTEPQLKRFMEAWDADWPDQSEVVHEFPDGWSIRQPTTKGDVHREGVLMRNCWRMGDDRFARKVRDEPIDLNGMENQFYSLRDHRNHPRVSFGMKLLDDYPHIYSVFGHGNTDAKPEYMDRIQEYANGLGVPVDHYQQGGLEDPDAGEPIGPEWTPHDHMARSELLAKEASAWFSDNSYRPGSLPSRTALGQRAFDSHESLSGTREWGGNWDFEPEPSLWEFTSDWADLHTEFKIPKHIGQRIRKWVDSLKWPKGAEKEDQRNYHITVVSVDQPTEEETEDGKALKTYWADHAQGRRLKFQSQGIDLFEGGEGDSAVVLRLSSDQWKEMALDFAEEAEARGLDPRRFPGGPKAHITLGFASGLPEGDDLDLSFHCGDFNINVN